MKCGVDMQLRLFGHLVRRCRERVRTFRLYLLAVPDLCAFKSVRRLCRHFDPRKDDGRDFGKETKYAVSDLLDLKYRGAAFVHSERDRLFPQDRGRIGGHTPKRRAERGACARAGT